MQARTTKPIHGVREIDQYNVVAFYSRDDEFGWMANTYRGYPVTIDGTTYPTTEHYFQAMKFPGNDPKEIAYRNAILAYNGSFAKFPRYARVLSYDHELIFGVEDWNTRSQEVMKKAIAAKLDQHPKLADALTQLPDNTIIIEATKNDSKWGDGGDGLGQNLLGQIFMTELRMRKNKQTQEGAEVLAKHDYEAFKQYRKEKYDTASMYDKQLGGHIKIPFLKRHPNIKYALIGIAIGLAVALPFSVIGILSSSAIAAAIFSLLITPTATVFSSIAGIAISSAIPAAVALLSAAALAASALLGVLVGNLAEKYHSRQTPGNGPRPVDAASTTARAMRHLGISRKPRPSAKSSAELGSYANAAVVDAYATPAPSAYQSLRSEASTPSVTPRSR